VSGKADRRDQYGSYGFPLDTELTLEGPTQPPIQWVPWALSLGVGRPGCEGDHSSPSSAEIKE